MNPTSQLGTPQATGALLSWDEVLEVAKSAFNVWVGQPELQWGKRAWHLLQDANLTHYRTELERYTVLFRLLVLGGIYSDFCDAAWEEFSEPPYSDWACSEELDEFLLGRLYAKIPGSDTYEVSVSNALETLIEEERPIVVSALKQSLGGDMGLYLSLWRSTRVPESEDQHEDEESDAFDASTAQLVAYNWISEGCFRYR